MKCVLWNNTLKVIFYFLSRFRNEFCWSWKEEKLTQKDVSKTISYVKGGRLSVNTASERHDVPRWILRNYFWNKTTEKEKLGRKAALTKKSGKWLWLRIFRLVVVKNFPIMSEILTLIVYEYCDKNGSLHRFSKGFTVYYWLKGFLKKELIS